MNVLTRALRMPAIDTSRLTTYLAFGIALLMAAVMASAATNEGTALQAAFETLDEMANGYGKQILTLMGFVMAAIGYIATNAAGVVMKFIGYAIFLGAALGAAITLVGAVI
jgi:hypothetical protein